MNARNIVVFYGSNRPNASAPKIAEWLKSKLDTDTRATFTFVNLAELKFPLYEIEWALKPEGPFPSPVYQQWSETIHNADGYIVITNEYNHSISPIIKNAIDLLGSAHWEKKPIGLMSYGGVLGGGRAAEHLRQVFAELYAMTIREQLVLPLAGAFDEQGKVRDSTVMGNVEKFTDLLLWWTDALKSARA